MKILSAKQIREADQYTIINEPIASIDLMERAVQALFEVIVDRFSTDAVFEIFCGKGNNGGDGLGLARMLQDAGYEVCVKVPNHSRRSSKEFETNFKRLPDSVTVIHFDAISEKMLPKPGSIVVDAMLGSGLDRPLEELLAETVQSLNSLLNYKIAVDIPTGLFPDDNKDNNLNKILVCDWTLTLQSAKWSFFHAKTRSFTGEIGILDIGLHTQYLEDAPSSNYFVDFKEVSSIYKPRELHSYKSTFGHAFLFAGKKGSIGASILSAQACHRSGAGLLTVCTPGVGLDPMQTCVPEAMVISDTDANKITEIPDIKRASAIGIGPGIGTEKETARVLKLLIQDAGRPMVLDADALNILAENPTWIPFLPPNTVLTPHIGEFRRLLGVKALDDDYLEELRNFSVKNKVIVVLKDSITMVADPSAKIHVLNFGSPALASAGSGDVLTGVILGLLSSGYSPLESSLLGVYLQGEAGRISGELYGLESSLARDVIAHLGDAFHSLNEQS